MSIYYIIDYIGTLFCLYCLYNFFFGIIVLLNLHLFRLWMARRTFLIGSSVAERFSRAQRTVAATGNRIVAGESLPTRSHYFDDIFWRFRSVLQKVYTNLFLATTLTKENHISLKIKNISYALWRRYLLYRYCIEKLFGFSIFTDT